MEKPAALMAAGLVLLTLWIMIPLSAELSNDNAWRSVLFLSLFIAGNVLMLVGLGAIAKTIRSGALLK